MLLNSELIIETTRRCNTVCRHCLRGKAEDKDISIIDMENVIKQFSSISDVVFSGGEPSLNPQAIEVFIELCKKYNVQVGNFGIATNAVRVSDRFMKTIMDLWLYCSDNKRSRLAVSNDDFHKDSLNPKEANKLFIFSFASMYFHGDEKIEYINEGYYTENFKDGRENIPIHISNVDYYSLTRHGTVYDLQLYLNCDGQIVLGCSWSYENQGKYILCKAEDSIYNAIKREGIPDVRYGYNG